MRYLSVCAKTSSGEEAHFEQNAPPPDPLPSDGRRNSQTRLSQLPKRLDTPTNGARFSPSHPMGEGRGEGECVPKSEVAFARVLGCPERTAHPTSLRARRFAGGAGFRVWRRSSRVA